MDGIEISHPRPNRVKKRQNLIYLYNYSTFYKRNGLVYFHHFFSLCFQISRLKKFSTRSYQNGILLDIFVVKMNELMTHFFIMQNTIVQSKSAQKLQVIWFVSGRLLVIFYFLWSSKSYLSHIFIFSLRARTKATKLIELFTIDLPASINIL